MKIVFYQRNGFYSSPKTPRNREITVGKKSLVSYPCCRPRLLVMPDCACAARLYCHICSCWPCRTGRAHPARLRALPCPLLSHTAALARACTRSAWPRGLCPLCSAMPPCLLTLSLLARAAMSAHAGHVRSCRALLGRTVATMQDAGGCRPALGSIAQAIISV